MEREREREREREKVGEIRASSMASWCFVCALLLIFRTELRGKCFFFTHMKGFAIWKFCFN